MRASTPDRDVRRRRVEENEETFIGSFWKKTPPKKTTVSHRLNDYTFRSVLAFESDDLPAGPTLRGEPPVGEATGPVSKLNARR